MIIATAWTPEDVSPEYYYPMARIWKLAVDGSESSQITKKKGPFMDSSPCWSPDGTKIAFVSDRDDQNFEVYVMNRDGSIRYV